MLDIEAIKRRSSSGDLDYWEGICEGPTAADDMDALATEVERLRAENTQACDSCQGLWRKLAERKPND